MQENTWNKKIIFLSFLLLLTGCSSETVILENIYVGENVMDVTNTSTPHQIYFTLVNKARQDAHCKAEFNLINLENQTRKIYDLGRIPQKSKRPTRIDFDMPFGLSEFNLTPICNFNQ